MTITTFRSGLRRFNARRMSARISSLALAGLLLAAMLSVSLPALACSGRLHIELSESGVYALDYATVVAQQPGLADCTSASLVLRNRGDEVPIRIVGDSEGKFGAGSRLEWVGQALHGPQSWFDQYSNVNVYQLAAETGAHARMQPMKHPADAKPVALRRRVHLEQENLQIRLNEAEMKPGEEPDVWEWAKLTPVDPKPFTSSFDIADLETRPAAAQMATLRVNLRGMSNVLAIPNQTKPVDHVVEVSINGKPLGAQRWDGRSEQRLQIGVPLTVLKAKGNLLSVQVPRRDNPADGAFIIDVVMFNWFELDYPASGDIASSSTAITAEHDGRVELAYARAGALALYDTAGGYQLLSAAQGARYRAAVPGSTELFTLIDGKALVPTLVRPIAELGLHAAAPGYDYLMVAHPRLLAAAQPLAEFHRQRGLRTALLDVDAVYDEFYYGISHPLAIRNLVAWGSQHWKVPPRYLLLVGDASENIYHDFRTDRLQSNAYAVRPHQTREELMLPQGVSTMPSTSYAQWNPELTNRNLIPTWQFPTPEGQGASDNGYATLKTNSFRPTIAVGRFPVVEPAEVSAIVAKTIAYMTQPPPGDWHRNVTFISTDEVATYKEGSDRLASELGSQGFSIRNLYTKLDAADAAAVHAELKRDLNAGGLLVHFLGHGGAFIWRVGPPADLFTLEDVAQLNNVGRYPMVLAMTCFSAPFANPTEDSIGERFLRERDKGAVAVFAASWTNSPNPAYSKLLIDELLKPGNRIGDAIVAAKAGIPDRTFVQIYNLLGDPALVLSRPLRGLRFMRGDDRWQDTVTVQVPERDFSGNVDVDWVDGDGVTLASRHYESRDARFTLPVPSSGAAELRVFAADLRSGYSAIDSLRLIEPSVPKAADPPPPEATKTAAIPVVLAQSPPPAPRPPAPRAGKVPDKITKATFEPASAKSAQAPVVQKAPPALKRP